MGPVAHWPVSQALTAHLGMAYNEPLAPPLRGVSVIVMVPAFVTFPLPHYLYPKAIGLIALMILGMLLWRLAGYGLSQLRDIVRRQRCQHRLTQVLPVPQGTRLSIRQDHGGGHAFHWVDLKTPSRLSPDDVEAIYAQALALGLVQERRLMQPRPDEDPSGIDPSFPHPNVVRFHHVTLNDLWQCFQKSRPR